MFDLFCFEIKLPSEPLGTVRISLLLSQYTRHFREKTTFVFRIVQIIPMGFHRCFRKHNINNQKLLDWSSCLVSPRVVREFPPTFVYINIDDLNITLLALRNTAYLCHGSSNESLSKTLYRNTVVTRDCASSSTRNAPYMYVT